jgi:NitT/TauT family transport system substrate-binding protein
MEKTRNRTGIVGFTFALFIAFSISGHALAAEMKKVIFAEGMQPPAASIYVAKAKGFWEEQGLDVELKPFTMGRLCMDAVLGGRADAGYMAETPPMLAAFKKQPIRLITAMESSNKNAKVLVRKDKGINKPSDLIGKQVACSYGTNGEYFMAAFLKAKGIDRKRLKVINLSPADMITAIVQGDVVAIFTWEPHLTKAKEILGNKSEFWLGGEIYREGFFVGVMEDYVKENPKVIEGILRGLIKADKFIKDNPDETIMITAPRVNMQPELLKNIWQWFDFRVSLEKYHLETMKGEGKWAMESGIAPKDAQMPDFRKIFYQDALKKIDPSRANL